MAEGFPGFLPCLWASCGMVAAAGAGWCRARPEAGRQPGTVIVLPLPDFMSDMSGMSGALQVKPAIPTFFTARHETTPCRAHVGHVGHKSGARVVRPPVRKRRKAVPLPLAPEKGTGRPTPHRVALHLGGRLSGLPALPVGLMRDGCGGE